MMISIITINKNNIRGLKRTISSVINQAYTDIEYIMIDGNSTDGSVKVLTQFEESLSYWVSEGDNGIYNAMNKGISRATGEYLLFLNSGDVLKDENTLSEVRHKYLTGKDIYYGNLLIGKSDGGYEKTYPDKLNFKYFFNKGHLPHPAMFIKRSLFNKVGKYNENLRIVADWEFTINAICKHNASYEHIDQVISMYDQNGISSRPENRSLIEKERNEVLQRNFPLFIDDYREFLNAKRKLNNPTVKGVSSLIGRPIVGRITKYFVAIIIWFFGKGKKQG